MNNKTSISVINNMNKSDFTNLFYNIVEYYSNISNYLFEKRPYENVNDFIQKAMNFLNNLSLEEKKNILKFHPDLAGKLAQEGKLTNESIKEQKAAGLDVITSEEKEYLTGLNKRYKEKYDFPFVICARENNFTSIKDKLQNRLLNTKENEIITGFEEVTKISKLRLMDLITE